MNKTLKGYVLGLLTAAFVAGTVSYAAQNVKIIIDGQELIAKDASGNRVYPIIENGTTYLPVRAIANAFGKEVYWDGPNYTVYLGKMDGSLEYPTTEIEDMVSIGDKAESTDALVDNYGNTYTHAIRNSNGNREMEYLLNMKYSHFKGVLYVPNTTTNNGTWYMKIIADGKTIYKSPDMNKTSSPINIDVNITGCNNLKIELSEYNGAYSWDTPTLCLGNAGFYQ